MAKRFWLPIVLLLALLGLAQSAQAIVEFGPLKGDNVGYASYWPRGLKEAVSSHQRVAGDYTEHMSFGPDWKTVNLYFNGDQHKFNEFMQQMAKVEGKGVAIHLHPGRAAHVKGFIKVKKPLPFDWHVTVFADGLLARDHPQFKDPTVEVNVNYYLSERGHLMGLDVPRKMNVRRGYDSEYLKAHKDDRAVQAIETFIRLREKTRAK